MDIRYCSGCGRREEKCVCNSSFNRWRKERAELQERNRATQALREFASFKSDSPKKPTPGFADVLEHIGTGVMSLGLLGLVASIIFYEVLEGKDLDNWKIIENYWSYGLVISFILLIFLGPLVYVIRKLAISIYHNTGKWRLYCHRCSIFTFEDKCPSCHSYLSDWDRE